MSGVVMGLGATNSPITDQTKSHTQPLDPVRRAYQSEGIGRSGFVDLILPVVIDCDWASVSVRSTDRVGYSGVKPV